MAESFEIHTIALDRPEARTNPLVAEYFALRHDAFKQEYKTTKYAREGTEADYAPGSRAYVVTLDGKAVACCGSALRQAEEASLYQEKLVDFEAVLPHLDFKKFCVAEAKAMVRTEACKNQGIYHALFDTMHAELKRQGVDILVATASPKSIRGSRSYFRQHGEPKDQFFLADPPLLHEPASRVRLMLMVESLQPEKVTIRTPEMIHKGMGAPLSRATMDWMLREPKLSTLTR